MKRLLISTIVFICIGIDVNAQSNTIGTGKQARATLTGKVIDARNNVPLAGATIYVNDLKIGVATEADGTFTLNNIPAGKHLVEISFVGYGTQSEFLEMNGEVKREFLLSPEIVEKNEVVVTGVSGATQSKRTPTPIDVVRRQELIQMTATNLVDAISQKPGIAQLSTGPAISKPVIRGLGYNRVVTVNDGVRQEGQQWGDEHGIEIDEYSVSRIEILKGPASLIYGSDAMAGVINIITNSPAPEGNIQGNLITNYQTNNRLRGIGGNLRGNYQGWNWNAYGSLKAAADYQNKYDGRVYNSKFNEKNYGGYLGYNKGWGYAHLIVSNFHQQLGLVEGDRDSSGHFFKVLPGGVSARPASDDFNSTNPHIPKQEIRHFKIISDNSFNIGAGRLGVNLASQRNQRMEFGNTDLPGEKSLWFNLQTFTYNAAYHWAERSSWRTSIGVNGLAQRNDNRGVEALIPEYSMFDFGWFLYSKKNWEKVSLSGGLRFDHRTVNADQLVDSTGLKFESFKKEFSNATGSVGISYLPSSLVTLKFNLARGFRTPSIPELASNGKHEGVNRYEYGNLSLKSETSFQVDAGLELNSEHLSFEASLFYNRINNFIFYRKLEAVGGGDSTIEVDGDMVPAFQFNQHEATLAGVEMVLDIHPHPLDWLHFENTFSFVRGQFSEAIEGTKNIPGIPAARLISQLGGTFYKEGNTIRNLIARLEMDANFRQDKAFTAYNTETTTPGYILLNATLGGEVRAKNRTLFSIYLNAVNVTDVAYQNHLSRLKYTAVNPVTARMGVFNMGRNFSIKVNVPISGKFRGG